MRLRVHSKCFSKTSWRPALLLTISILFLSGCATSWDAGISDDDPIPELKRAVRYIERHYFEPKSRKELEQAAIRGMKRWIKENKPSPKKVNKRQILSSENSSIDSEFLKYTNQFEMNPKELEYAAIEKLLDDLDEEGTKFIPPDLYRAMSEAFDEGTAGVGVKLEKKDDYFLITPMEGSPAEKAGIRKNDILINIDDFSAAQMTLGEALFKLRGPVGLKVRVRIKRSNSEAPLDIELERKKYSIRSLESRIINGDIIYIRLLSFQYETPEILEDHLEEFEVENVKGLIIDLRDNPGGLLKAVVQVVDQFLPPDYPILTIAGISKGKAVSDEYKAIFDDTWDDFSPIFILVNEKTAVGSEIMAGALQEWERAFVIGTKTFGRGTVQTLIPLGQGAAMQVTVGNMLLPSGWQIEKSGIKPDIVVEPVLGVDAPIQKVIQLMDQYQIEAGNKKTAKTKVLWK